MVLYIRLEQIIPTKISLKVFLSLIGQQFHIAPILSGIDSIINPLNIYRFFKVFHTLSEITIVKFYSTGFLQKPTLSVKKFTGPFVTNLKTRASTFVTSETCFENTFHLPYITKLA